MCVCVAKPVAVELRCHATALIIYYNQLIYNSVTETSTRISLSVTSGLRRSVPRSSGGVGGEISESC